jgi:hypothetical protein
VTGWTDARIPITVPPLAGEALDSWIEAYARRLHTCSRGFLNHLGLSGCQPRHMVMLLTDTERDTLATATGTAPTRLDAMTLARFDGVAVTLNRNRRTAEHPPAWRRHSGSRYCPACLRDDGGRWQLAWRLPWAFACLRHHRLLADTCPACRRRTHPDRPGHRGEPTVAGPCTAPFARRNRGVYTPPCGHPLTDVTTATVPAGGLVEHAVRHLDQLITTGAGGDSPARADLDDLFLLGHRALAALHHGGAQTPDTVERVVDECGGITPPCFSALGPVHAHTVAVATTLAVAANADDQTGDGLLAWIVGHHHQLARPEPKALLARWQHCTTQLTRRVLALFDDKLRVQHRLACATPTLHPRLPRASHTQLARRAAALPALLWPDWAMRLIPATNASNTLEATRAALAVLTLIPSSRLTYQQAVDLLGGYTTRASVRGLLDNLTADQTAATITLLVHLADTLDAAGSPIDYARRRALFTTGATVDRPAYTALAANHGWRQPSSLQLRILDRHLVTLLTGTAGATRVGPTRWGAANAFNPLLAALPAPVRQFVHDQARQLLDAHGVDEPLTWQPPPGDPDTPWPGIDPADINPRVFAAAFTRHAAAPRPLARLHDATGMSTIHIRLYPELLDLDMPEPQWNALVTDASGDILNPSRLRHLYNQQHPLRDIARRSLTTETVIRRTLTNGGTHLQPTRPHRSLITREWFEQHYLNTGNTVQQAAREAGCSATTLRLYAHQHGIPFGHQAPPANPFASWSAYHTPPPAVIAACSGRHGIDYVRQVLTMPRHHTQRTAAAALGIHEVVLMRHRQHVERAAGIRIFQPGRTRLIPTHEGERFLHHAAKALRRLDKLSRNTA